MMVVTSLLVANALFVASENLSNVNNPFITYPSTGARLLLRGGGIHNRKENHPAQSREASFVFSTTSDENYSPSFFSKEEPEEVFIQEMLEANFLFQGLMTTDGDEEGHLGLTQVIAAFEKHTFKKRDFLCKQGDTEDTDYLYLIASGTCSVSIDGKQLPDPYGTMGSGSLIGDLAMLYGTARAATVRAETPVTVFRLHRTDFDHFLHYSSDVDEKESETKTQTSKIDEIRQEVKIIDAIIDQISGVKSRYHGDIIRQFQPNRRWLWGCWNGTILQHAWKPAVANMIISFLFMTAFHLASNHAFKTPITWPMGSIPDPEHSIILRLKGLYKLWGYTMSITTLMLSFYLNQAYGLWRDIYVKGRKIQGRLNDIGLVLACSAERDPKTGSYTDRANALLDEVAVSSRLCHAFSWAGFVERFNPLLTSRGLSRMLSRGIMTRSQYDTLGTIPRSMCGPQHTTLMWIMSRIFQGMRDGVIPGDDATKGLFIQKICDMRGTLGGVGDSLDGKIPLAYAHFVQVMIDVFLAMAPFALYSELGIWSMLAVGVLNIFYSGMNDLAKILLDPLDNCDQSFYKDSSVNMDVGVLIRESNAGSNRWKAGLRELPFKYRA